MSDLLNNPPASIDVTGKGDTDVMTGYTPAAYIGIRYPEVENAVFVRSRDWMLYSRVPWWSLGNGRRPG